MWRVSRREVSPTGAETIRSPTITDSPSEAAAVAIIWNAARTGGSKASPCEVSLSRVLCRVKS